MQQILPYPIKNVSADQALRLQ